MAEAHVRGITLVYETFGTDGPWIALSPGSRRAHGELIPIAERLAARGYRVLLHDRRNCGASSVGIDYLGSENEMWADDLRALAEQLGALPLYVGGSSSGARLALLFALRHRRDTRGLLLWRLTGGREATLELARLYYGQFIALAREGGMAAVCASEHFAACIRARPSNRDHLMGLAVDEFISAMQRWNDDFLASAARPVIGATEDQLKALDIPALLVPGADKIHAPETAFQLNALIPHSRLEHIIEPLPPEQRPAEWQAQWAGKEPVIAQVIGDFLETVGGVSPVDECE